MQRLLHVVTNAGSAHPFSIVVDAVSHIGGLMTRATGTVTMAPGPWQQTSPAITPWWCLTCGLGLSSKPSGGFDKKTQGALDDQALIASKGKFTIPILALGGEKSFGPMMATIMRAAATNVTQGIVPDSGHWIMEENPTATISMVRTFLAAKP